MGSTSIDKKGLKDLLEKLAALNEPNVDERAMLTMPFKRGTIQKLFRLQSALGLMKKNSRLQGNNVLSGSIPVHI
jgi:hypothetical protein